MVGARGFEPPTSWSRSKRASHAALRPERTPAPAPCFPARLGTILSFSTRGVKCSCAACRPTGAAGLAVRGVRVVRRGGSAALAVAFGMVVRERAVLDRRVGLIDIHPASRGARQSNQRGKGSPSLLTHQRLSTAQLPRKVAGHEVPRRVLRQGRRPVAAHVLDVAAPPGEPAGVRRLDGAGHVALQDDPLALHV